MHSVQATERCLGQFIIKRSIFELIIDRLIGLAMMFDTYQLCCLKHFVAQSEITEFESQSVSECAGKCYHIIY